MRKKSTIVKTISILVTFLLLLFMCSSCNHTIHDYEWLKACNACENHNGVRKIHAPGLAKIVYCHDGTTVKLAQ
jgi:Zn finger protein HypA/HybF involved in hydrogenase expression